MAGKAPTEVVVIGAGIAGASTAFHLADWGVKTTLIERQHPASGPTGRSSALLHAFYLMPELSQLAARGIDILRRVPELTGQSAGFNEVGMLWAAGPQAESGFRAAVGRIRKEGARIEAISAADCAKLAPDFNWDGVAVAAWEPTTGYADPYSTTNALANGARDRGATVKLDTRVARIATQGGRVVGVETDKGERIAADMVVAATGVWTKPLVAQLGVELPIHIERHCIAVVEARGMARKIMPFSWCDDPLGNYGRPDGEDIILLGGWSGGGTGDRNPEAERGFFVTDPETYKEGVDDDESVEILKSFLPRIPALEHLGLRPGYAGLYDMSPDDTPIIDRIPGVDGLIVVCGSSGHGFKMGPGVGEAVAKFVTTGEPGILKALSLARFARSGSKP